MKYIAYGVVITNRKYIREERTLAYQQLLQFGADKIIIDIICNTRRRPKLESLIAEMKKDDILYLYSIDNLILGNCDLSYFEKIIKKGIKLYILDFSGRRVRRSEFNTVDKKYNTDELLEKFKLYSSNYLNESRTGLTKKKRNEITYYNGNDIFDKFREIYFAYEGYRITLPETLELLSKHCDIKSKLTFFKLCVDYENSIVYAEDVAEYCKYDSIFDTLPKRAGNIPPEFNEITDMMTNQKHQINFKQRFESAIKQLQIKMCFEDYIRLKLLSEKVPKPRKPIERKVQRVFYKGKLFTR